MTASMPTFIGRNITAIRPTHDCFYANLGHIMTAFMPTIGQIVWLQKVNLSLLFCQLYLTSWWYHCLHANSSWIIYLLWTHLLILNHLAGLLDTNSNDHTASDKNSLLPDHVLNRKVHVMPQTMGTWRLNHLKSKFKYQSQLNVYPVKVPSSAWVCCHQLVNSKWNGKT